MDSLSQKRCTKCGELKPHSEFYCNKARKDGHSSRCKTCEDKCNREWAIANREKTRGYVKKCMMASIEKYREYYRQYKEKNREQLRAEGRRYAASHKEKVSECSRRHYASHRDATLARCRDYRTARPEKNAEYGRNRRSRKNANGGVVTAKEWQEVLDKYGHKCLRCQRTDVKLSMDHIIPLKLGGTHTKDNVQPLCIPCNSWKNARIIDFRPF